MKPYIQLTAAERQAEYAALQARFEEYKALGLKLNMARGKPGVEQLRLSAPMLNILTIDDCEVDGIDARNYGELTGLPCTKKLFADLLGTQPEEILVGGNASLSLMYDLIAKAYTHGLKNSTRPWSKEETSR